jgi:hypothetical protein
LAESSAASAGGFPFAVVMDLVMPVSPAERSRILLDDPFHDLLALSLIGGFVGGAFLGVRGGRSYAQRFKLVRERGRKRVKPKPLQLVAGLASMLFLIYLGFHGLSRLLGDAAPLPTVNQSPYGSVIFLVAVVVVGATIIFLAVSFAAAHIRRRKLTKGRESLQDEDFSQSITSDETRWRLISTIRKYLAKSIRVDPRLIYPTDAMKDLTGCYWGIWDFDCVIFGVEDYLSETERNGSELKASFQFQLDQYYRANPGSRIADLVNYAISILAEHVASKQIDGQA